MIEGKLGHHFQVDEMRHIASTACPAFTGCRSAERCCCPCTTRPPCPAFTADKKHILAEAAFSQDWELSLPGLCRVRRSWKELVPVRQDLLQLIWSLCCRLQMLSTEHILPASSHPPQSSFPRDPSRMAAAPHTAQHPPSDRLCKNTPSWRTWPRAINLN